MIQVSHLSCDLGGRRVLSDISFSLEKGQLLSVLGPNGVGKSTLFRCLLGLVAHCQGTILLDGTAIEQLSPRQQAQKIAYVPQRQSVAFHYTIQEMVLMGTAAQHSLYTSPGPAQLEHATQALNQVGISHLATRMYHQISGGEQQLTLIARALAQQAPILILDEPVSNLDYGNQMRILRLMQNLTQQGYAVIQSTHHPDQAYQFSHKILALKDGSVLAYGRPQEVITSQQMEQLYNISVQVLSLQEDHIRICIPNPMQ